ncbi:MAG: hypothetical protein ACP6KW_09295 [Candidatus Thorarchaeota archaeon]
MHVGEQPNLRELSRLVGKYFLHGIPFAVIFSLFFFRFISPTLIPFPQPSLFAPLGPIGAVVLFLLLIYGCAGMSSSLARHLWETRVSSGLGVDFAHGLALVIAFYTVHSIPLVIYPNLALIPESNIYILPLALVDGVLARSITSAFEEDGSNRSSGTKRPSGSDEAISVSTCPNCGFVNEFLQSEIEADGTGRCYACNEPYFVLSRDTLITNGDNSMAEW